MSIVRAFSSPTRALLLAAFALVGGAALGVACGPPDCRYDPNCGGGSIGAFCSNNAQCFDGYCCGKNECNGGMCTFQCDGDVECPAGMLCQHGACFFACANNADCLPDQKCKHDRVCEWD